MAHLMLHVGLASVVPQRDAGVRKRAGYLHLNYGIPGPDIASTRSLGDPISFATGESPLVRSAPIFQYGVRFGLPRDTCR